MEKAYKIALSKLEPETFPHNIFAKNAENFAKICKNAKNFTQKGQNPFFKRVKKLNIGPL